jgi:acid stress-induced BolA-like protein IbaG/YrbA
MAQISLTKPPYVDRLSSAITDELPGAMVDVEHVRGDRYRFIVVWGRFDSMGHPERQQIVWDLAERVIGPELLNVTMILTLGNDDLPPDDSDDAKE